MAIIGKILGQSVLPNGSQVAVYTVPINKESVISSLTTSNFTGTEQTIKVWIVKNGESIDNKNILFPDINVPKNDFTFVLRTGITLTDGDSIQGECSAITSLNLQIFGHEKDV